MTADRVTGALSTVLLVLGAVVAGEAWYLWGVSPPAASAERPVVTGDIAAQAAVEAAAQDTARIFTNSWRNYDGHVAQAAALMTEPFAAQYRRSAAPVRRSVLASRTRTTTRVAAAGLVRATADQVTALVFLDQFTTTHGGPPSYAGRRALVTMVRTDAGWLVGNVQTQ
jgi:Mce-associated membrane protein